MTFLTRILYLPIQSFGQESDYSPIRLTPITGGIRIELWNTVHYGNTNTTNKSGALGTHTFTIDPGILTHWGEDLPLSLILSLLEPRPPLRNTEVSYCQ